ncbi:hypothetical protein VPFG_00122 [Vibrio phage nt-1]|uniref:Uncharacterized protein n=1 Tax=Vibrio phage nt-1 TaxID=115992 RepID=R9TF91_9CAUD|nr:hypothetical protein VPFG_00122 [Vibrio phage nt-1]AGN30124.1 hypothetical protein VPFG_00122 [Vibrio phage nt-1]
MKLVPMTVDYSEDIYTMSKYLLLNETHPDCPETKIGRFMLGRATGHTTALKQTADRLRKEGYRVLEVYYNTANLHMHRPNNKDRRIAITYSTLVQDNSNLYRGMTRDSVPDIVLCDAYSVAEQRIRGVREVMDELPYMFRHIFNKQTAFFFIQ